MRSTYYSRKKRVSRKSLRGGRKSSRRGRKSLRRRGRKSLRRKGRKSLRRKGRKSLRGGADRPMEPDFDLDAEEEYEQKFKSMNELTYAEELESYIQNLRKFEEKEEDEQCEINPLNMKFGEGQHNQDHATFVAIMNSREWGKVAKKSFFNKDIRDSKLIDYAKLGDKLADGIRHPVNGATKKRNELIKETMNQVLDAIINAKVGVYKDDMPDAWSTASKFSIISSKCDTEPVMSTKEDVDAVRDQCKLIKGRLQKKEHDVLFTETNFNWRDLQTGRTYLYSPLFNMRGKYYKISIPDQHFKVKVGEKFKFQFIK